MGLTEARRKRAEHERRHGRAEEHIRLVHADSVADRPPDGAAGSVGIPHHAGEACRDDSGLCAERYAKHVVHHELAELHEGQARHAHAEAAHEEQAEVRAARRLGHREFVLARGSLSLNLLCFLWEEPIEQTIRRSVIRRARLGNFEPPVRSAGQSVAPRGELRQAEDDGAQAHHCLARAVRAGAEHEDALLQGAREAARHEVFGRGHNHLAGRAIDHREPLACQRRCLRRNATQTAAISWRLYRALRS